MCDRIFVEWGDDAYLTSGYNPDFQANLVEMVAQYGPPSKVEFRAAGTGYAAPTPCEDCGKPYAKCRCDGYDPDAGREPSKSSEFLGALAEFYMEKYGHLIDGGRAAQSLDASLSLLAAPREPKLAFPSS